MSYNISRSVTSKVIIPIIFTIFDKNNKNIVVNAKTGFQNIAHCQRMQ